MNRFARWQLAHRSVNTGGSIISRHTAARTALLTILFAAIFFLASTHRFFVLNDISISGLDSSAAAVVRSIVRHQRQNYFLFSSRKMMREISDALVLDDLEIKKKFPHTLIINAHELGAVVTISTKINLGTMAADGRIVRVMSNQDEIIEADVPHIELLYDLSFEPHDIPLAAAPLESIQELLKLGNNLNQRILLKIIVAKPDDEMLLAHYNGGVEAILATRGDIRVQIEKLRAALRQYPAARIIDVRFGDKAFVSF